MNATNVILYGSACRVSAAGASSSVAAVGFASYVYRNPSVLTATNFTVYASACTVTATGANSVAALGFASCTFSALSSITITNLYLYALQSVVSVAGVYAVSAMGLASYSSTSSIITAANATLHASGCNASFPVMGGKQYSISLLGFASSGYSNDAALRATDSTVYASGCIVTTTGASTFALAVLGITSFTYTSPSSTVTATNLILYASGCIVTATAASCIAAVGIISCSSGTYSSSGRIAVSGVLMGCCDTRMALLNAPNVACIASAVATFTTVTTPSIMPNTRWVLLRSRIEVAKGPCMTLIPSSSLPSVAVNVQLLCDKVGWSEQRLFCWSNVTFNGNGLDPSSTPTSYTNSPCPYSKATCDEVVPPPVGPAPMQPPSPPDDHTCTLTQSRTLASRSRSASSTRALPRLRKTTSARPYSLSLSQQETVSDTTIERH